ncbi:hypothetical protein GQ54DRAFT_297669 [Martensiomyces pterosporus]|nr:hypothetical protein GQ54DRAFT_297669 [Martensiomyces pterosporus]
MASHLVSFIRGNPHTSDRVEAFVMEAFDEHLDSYSRTSPNPRNILRDNNLATMLVVCYLQQSCRSYLVSILQPVMRAIGPYVENCELDPMRLPPGSDLGVTSGNSYNLYCVCRSVLDAVFSAGRHAPLEMRRLCAFIRRRIETTWNIPPPTPAIRRRQQEAELPILELREWEHDLKSTVQADIMSDIKSALDEWLGRPESACSRRRMPSSKGGTAAAATAAKAATASMRSSNQSSSGSSSHATASISRLMSANSCPGAPLQPNEGSAGASESGSYATETRRTIEDMMSSSFANINKLDTSLSLDSSSIAQSSDTTASHEEASEGHRQPHNPHRGFQSSGSARQYKRHSSKRQSGSYFSPVETVISMLIFVRFFIPILTAPDAYGLDVRLSPSNRRGLLLCAKVLAVLCNGVSFGSKEPYLLPMNGLIREYRPKLRRYLHVISSNVSYTVESALDADDDSSGDECSDEDSVTIDELASQFQIVTVGAKIATKEEQRKSRMSVSRGSHLNSGAFALEKDLPSVPPIPQGMLLGSHPATLTPPSAVPSSRTTIDIPFHPPGSMQSAGSCVVAPNEIDDGTFVTLDFLLCLESSLGKLEGAVQEHARLDPEDERHVQALFRELKPIILYAEHLTLPGRPSGTAAIIAPANQSHQVQTRRYALPFMFQESKPADAESPEERGHRRTSTLPENYRFANTFNHFPM